MKSPDAAGQRREKIDTGSKEKNGYSAQSTERLEIETKLARNRNEKRNQRRRSRRVGAGSKRKGKRIGAARKILSVTRGTTSRNSGMSLTIRGQKEVVYKRPDQDGIRICV